MFLRVFLQVNALRHISLNPHPNFMKFFDDFEVNERPCLVFELFHMDLMEFTERYENCIANLTAVRAIAQQVRVTRGPTLAKPHKSAMCLTQKDREAKVFRICVYNWHQSW